MMDVKVNGKINANAKALIDTNSTQSTLCHRLVSDNTTGVVMCLGSMGMLNELKV